MSRLATSRFHDQDAEQTSTSGRPWGGSPTKASSRRTYLVQHHADPKFDNYNSLLLPPLGFVVSTTEDALALSNRASTCCTVSAIFQDQNLH